MPPEPLDATPADPDAMYRYAAEQLEAGKSKRQVTELLEERGLHPDDADTVVGQLTDARADAQRTAGKRNLGFGALWFFGGMGVTIATMAANPDGKGVLFYGAMLLGAFKIVRGFYQLATAK